ncbi:MAG: hypothetical protein KatS3mg119_0953 [Rhodothalassiaceae bacterium]|nr:MAG: hypothetical protein KatS3mg119_0953 [Rhodothalassiaceae bacterium]
MLRRLFSEVLRVRRAENGVTAIEYAMIAALIALVIVASVRLVGLATSANIQRATDAVAAAAP